MSRMIDADALREQLVWCKEQAGRFDTYWDDVIERVDSLPTIDGQCDACYLKETNGWIGTNDRLPEEKKNPYTLDYQEVLCVLNSRFGTDVRVYKFGKGHFWSGPKEIDRLISYWMPFPEPPKEEKDDA